MIRLLLAFILTVSAALLPVAAVSAACTDASAVSHCCCGGDEPMDCAALQDSCCAMSEQVPALPPVQHASQLVPNTAALPLVRQLNNVLAQVSPQAHTRTAQHKPLHLASNKVYLEKRRLLI